MAIADLHCVREGNELAVLWSWGQTETSATIKVTHLLNGEAIEEREISRVAYRFALSSPRHGPVVRVPEVPLKVEVSDADSTQSLELSDVHYVVNWRLVRRSASRPKRMLWLSAPSETETRLQVRFPPDIPFAVNQFCYVLVRQGARKRADDPIGFFPSLQAGVNEYGVMIPPGRELELSCSPDQKDIAPFFRFTRLPDQLD